MDGSTFTIPENSNNGFSAGSMLALGGSKYNYSILSGSVAGAFTIIDSTGEITVKDSSLLNYEVHPSISLRISLKDALYDSISPARGTCLINLSDVNEKPSLVNSRYYAFVNDSIGAVAGKIFVQDEDKGQNHTFSIKSQSEGNILNINNSTGELIINDNSPLSSLVSKTIIFTVDVSDNGSPALSDEKEYSLEILDKPVLTVINSRVFKNNIIVYPNPAGNYLTIKVDGSTKNMVIRIINSKGVVVTNQRISPDLTIITTSNLVNGLYYLQVLSEGQVIGIRTIEIISVR
jgi:hypothetical protein